LKTWFGSSKVINAWVINASPLIGIGRIDCLGLLSQLVPLILIPERVLNEVATGLGKDASTARTLAWAAPYRVADVSVPQHVAGWDLGSGETQVIALCLQDRSRRAVLDDGDARRCAITVGTPMIGTLGVLLQAKRDGLITQVRPLTERLVRSGIYLDQSLIDRALARVGE